MTVNLFYIVLSMLKIAITSLGKCPFVPGESNPNSRGLLLEFSKFTGITAGIFWGLPLLHWFATRTHGVVQASFRCVGGENGGR